MLYYTILYYTILCHAILYYTIPYYNRKLHGKIQLYTVLIYKARGLRTCLETGFGDDEVWLRAFGICFRCVEVLDSISVLRD